MKSFREVSLPWNVKLLGLASLLNDIASEMIYPLLPQFLMTVLGGSRVALGVIEGAADAASSLLKLWSGSWSDRLGRRKGLIVAGYALAALSRPGIGLARVPWHVGAARLMDRVGKGFRSAPRDAMISLSTDPGTRGLAFGFHRAMDHLGAAIGPLLAAAFLYFWPGELRTLFLATLIPGLLVVLLLWLGLKEQAGSVPSKTGPWLSRGLFHSLPPSYRRYLGALSLFSLGNASDAFFLLRAGEVGIPTWQLPVLWSAFHVAKSAGNLVGGRLTDRLGPRLLIAISWGLYGVICVGFALAGSVGAIWFWFLAYAGYYALSEPSEKSLVAELAGREQQGLAFGWFNGVLGLAALPASLIFGAIYQIRGAEAAFGWSAVLAVLGLVALTTLGTRPKEAQPDGML